MLITVPAHFPWFLVVGCIATGGQRGALSHFRPRGAALHSTPLIMVTFQLMNVILANVSASRVQLQISSLLQEPVLFVPMGSTAREEQ